MGSELGTHYFLGQRLLGTSPRQAYWADMQPATCHTAYLCPVCGEVWGRVLQSDKSSAEWIAQRRFCVKHGNGSFIAPWSQQFDELPLEVLTHELNLQLTLYDRRLQCLQSS